MTSTNKFILVLLFYH